MSIGNQELENLTKKVIDVIKKQIIKITKSNLRGAIEDLVVQDIIYQDI
jgi:hypothetical protein